MFTMGMTGRKWEIFVAAVEVISDKSYEGISIRDISRKVGIKAASLYNHFTSKEEILDTIYEYLETFYAYEVKSGEENRFDSIDHKDIVDLLLQKWRWPEKMHDMLRRILRIVLSRMYFDQRARDLFYKTTVDWSYKIDKPLLEKLIALGRIEPFDIEAFLVAKVALDVYATLRFAQDETLPDGLWEKAEELLIRKIVLKPS